MAILFEDGGVHRGLDRRARVPAELVRETSSVALVAGDFPATFVDLVNHLHCAHDIDAWVEPALVEDR